MAAAASRTLREVSSQPGGNMGWVQAQLHSSPAKPLAARASHVCGVVLLFKWNQGWAGSWVGCIIHRGVL